MPTRFESYAGPDDVYYVKLIDGTGRIILQCTGCPSATDNVRCINKIRSSAQNDALYERSSTPEGKWYFSLRSPDGATIAISRMHSSSAELEHAIAAVKSAV
jgi:hypothetical protein